MSIYERPLSPSFELPPSKVKHYIFTRGYFEKTLLPVQPTDQTRYCQVKCLLPTANTSTCNASYIIKWDNTSTGNLTRHLKKTHPDQPTSIQEESIITASSGNNQGI